MERDVDIAQGKKLLMILEDNGIEHDECPTVAEAICFALDLSTEWMETVEE